MSFQHNALSLYFITQTQPHLYTNDIYMAIHKYIYTYMYIYIGNYEEAGF